MIRANGEYQESRARHREKLSLSDPYKKMSIISSSQPVYLGTGAKEDVFEQLRKEMPKSAS